MAFIKSHFLALQGKLSFYCFYIWDTHSTRRKAGQEICFISHTRPNSCRKYDEMFCAPSVFLFRIWNVFVIWWDLLLLHMPQQEALVKIGASISQHNQVPNEPDRIEKKLGSETPPRLLEEEEARGWRRERKALLHHQMIWFPKKEEKHLQSFSCSATKGGCRHFTRYNWVRTLQNWGQEIFC